MKLKHNKKRNVGLIYEQLVSFIALQLIEGNKERAKIATKILETRYKKTSEIYREWRLFDAITRVPVDATAAAASILIEAKRISSLVDKNKLEREKTSLVNDINNQLGKDFYFVPVKNYRSLATIQLAINEWRSSAPDLRKLILLEKKVGEVLLEKKEEQIDETIEHTDKLVLKIMTEKINRRWGDMLPEESSMIKMYVFDNDKKKILQKLSENRDSALAAISHFKNESKSPLVIEKLERVRERILSEKLEVSDSCIMNSLMYSRLVNEIKGDAK